MNHQVFGRKLSRSTNERKRLLNMLASDLILNGRIETTFAKAKSVQPMVEKLVTKAMKAGSSDIYEIRKVIRRRDAYKKLMDPIAHSFIGRPGGYTRIVKTSFRRGDNSEMVLLEFINNEAVPSKLENEKIVKKIKKLPIQTVKINKVENLNGKTKSKKPVKEVKKAEVQRKSK